MENKLQGWFIFGRLSRLFFSFTPKHDKNVWRPHLITSDIYCLVFVPRVLLNSAFQLWTIKVSSQQSCSLQMFSKCSEEQMQKKKNVFHSLKVWQKEKWARSFLHATLKLWIWCNLKWNYSVFSCTLESLVCEQTEYQSRSWLLNTPVQIVVIILQL